MRNVPNVNNYPTYNPAKDQTPLSPNPSTSQHTPADNYATVSFKSPPSPIPLTIAATSSGDACPPYMRRTFLIHSNLRGITSMVTKVHVTLWNYVVLTSMRDILELV
jgi:hypothetical protein